MEPTRKQLEEALRYLRVPRDGYEAMLPLVRDGFAELSRFARPAQSWLRLPLAVNGEGIALDDGSVTYASADLAALLRNCRECVVMAVTLGPAVDRQTQLFSRNDMARAVVFDSCASVWADSLCDEIERELKEQLLPGKFLTPRFSPGYGDVPMEFTRDLLRITDASRRIGLTLSEKGMMIPIKSVTAILGISDRPEKRRRSCADCALTTCQYRRKGGTCHES